MRSVVCLFTSKLLLVPNYSYCLVTEAVGCEQLAQGCCAAASRPGLEPATLRSQVRRPTTKPPLHFLCSCCFRPIATWLSLRCWSTLIIPFTDCFHWAKLPTLFQKFCNNCYVSKTKFSQFLDPSFILVRYFSHNQSYTPNCDYDLKYWRIYYNAICCT